MIHFAVAALGIEHMAKMSGMSQITIFAMGLYFIWSLTSLGLLFDKSVWGWFNEALRSVVCLLVLTPLGPIDDFILPETMVKLIFSSSLLIASVSVGSHLFLVSEAKQRVKGD